VQPNPKTPEPEPEPADDLDTLLMEAMEAMDLADAGALILAEAMRMAREDE
jgi:hypothetical protein